MSESFADFARNLTKMRLASGKLSVCMSFRQFENVEMVRAVKACGYDSLYVDLEHGRVSPQAAAQICATALDVGVAPLVRVPKIQSDLVGFVLDGGAMGIIFPHIDTPELARAAVAACKYPPKGHRGFNSAIPQTGYRKWPAVEVREVLNNETLVICQVESGECVENINEIAAVDGVDILFIGTNDLCADLGIDGQLDSPEVEHAYRATIDACKKYGKYCGVGGFSGREDLIKKYIEMGGRFISAGADQAFFMGGARKRAEFIKSINM
ncbi:HpcH/HpaI aldolase family protein [Shumkonia mesophila]|uniref:HpcH/HpaI aldolase family protein n=1 Tax=Shumkonia mesophila TaxID=2838854 RepID=UPI002934206C|nr:aldolase/citrate lyase family protein [Shumkonia mesophila]